MGPLNLFSWLKGTQRHQGMIQLTSLLKKLPFTEV